MLGCFSSKCLYNHYGEIEKLYSFYIILHYLSFYSTFNQAILKQHNTSWDNWDTPRPELSDTGEYCAVTHFDDPFNNRHNQIDSDVNDADNSVDSLDYFVENVGYGEKYYVTTSCRPLSAITESEFFDWAIDPRNRSEYSDGEKVSSEDTETISSEFGSDARSGDEIDSNISISVKSSGSSLRPGIANNEFTQLFENLELFDSVSSTFRTENHKLIGDDGTILSTQDDFENNTDGFENDTHGLENQSYGVLDDKKNLTPVKESETTMSKEARFAVIETLNDMKKKKGADVNAEIRNKGVTAQKRLQNNRLKYDRYKTIAETKNTFPEKETKKYKGSAKNRKSITRYDSYDSVAETAVDDYSSAFSSEINTKYTDGSSSAEDTHVQKKGKLLPSIDPKRRSAKRLNSAATQFYSLEKAKRTNYRIPGIGKFDIVASPDDFRITPPGFDSRYDPQPIIYKEEREPPPVDIQQKSIQKCKKWLKNVHLSPLSSLKPSHK